MSLVLKLNHTDYKTQPWPCLQALYPTVCHLQYRKCEESLETRLLQPQSYKFPPIFLSAMKHQTS